MTLALGITILMSLTFFMSVVSDMQPPSSETPLIGAYFSCIMIMVASSVVSNYLIRTSTYFLSNGKKPNVLTLIDMSYESTKNAYL